MLKKNFWLTFCIGILLFILSLVLIFISSYENIGFLTVISVLLLLACIIAFPMILVGMHNNEKNKLISQQKQIEKQKDLARFDIALAKSGLKPSRTLHFHKIHFAVDTVNNLINFTSIDETRTLAFSDLISFELIEDGQMVLNSSTGSAVAGGLLFGVAGAVVGSTMKKSTNVCTTLQLRISVNDIANPSIVQKLIVQPGVNKNHPYYADAFNYAKEVCSTLAVIQKQSA